MSSGPKVTLVAHTIFAASKAADESGYVPQERYLGIYDLENEIDGKYWNEENDVDEEEIAALNEKLDEAYDLVPRGIDELAEFAGRNCYQSWQRPNPETATNEGYNRNIINQKHFSVFEHGSATFLIKNVSTALLGQLTRHRHLSYSVLSKRYVDESDAGFVMHPNLVPFLNNSTCDYPDCCTLLKDIERFVDEAKDLYNKIVDTLTAGGLERKRAREAARTVLPQGIETVIVVTGNMRAWREVVEKRNGDGADEEIKALATELLRELKTIAPHTFQDL